MKRCPQCHRVETDDKLAFCRTDGVALINDSGSFDSQTAKFGSGSIPSEIETSLLPHTSSSPDIHRSTGPTTALPAAQVQTTTHELTKPRRRGFVLAALVIPLMLFLALGYFIWSRNRTTAIESIAVMPFVNESGNADVEYLSDGMTETLISNLSQLQNLNVKPRSSVFRYKGKAMDAKTIGQELNVQAILNGKVVQRGPDLSLFVELIDVALDKVVWSQQYNRKQTDLVSLQSEIATDVSGKLRTKLSGVEVQKVARTYTTDPEAYRLYLQGRFNWNKRNAEGIRKAITHFNQALEKDPSYALAYAGLANCYISLDAYSLEPPKEVIPKAKAAATRALEIDSNLAEAHTALATYYYDWDWPAAEREFRRAIELNPNYATAHQWYAEFLAYQGRAEESFAEMQRARELDPLSLIINSTMGKVLYQGRRVDQSITQLHSTIEMDPNFVPAHSHLARAYMLKGMYPEAIAELEKAVELSRGGIESKGLLAQAYALAGRREEALRILAEMKEQSKTRYISSYAIALVYAGLGDKDQAFQFLEKAYVAHDYLLIGLKVHVGLDSLRTDPRFADLVRRVGMPG